MKDDYIRIWAISFGVTNMQCIKCDVVIKQHVSALTTGTLREWLAAAESHTCGGEA